MRYHYRIDASDTIIEVDPLWLAFAKENGAPELTDEAVMGRSLWDFLEGEATRFWYEQLHNRVRSTDRSAVFPFRCDSPRLQRHMQMTIRHAGEGELLYESTIVRVESQRPVRLLDSGQDRSEDFLTICSCCRRALLEPETWLDVADISARLKLYEMDKVPQLRHTICPDCAKAVANH